MRLTLKQVSKWYFRGKGDSNRFFAVEACDLCVEPGKLVVLTGRSGSGKTTLLHMAAGLLTPDSGKVLADEEDLYAMDDRKLSAFRNRCMGVIPQGQSILPALTVLENIRLPKLMYGKDAAPGPAREDEKAQEWLERLGIAHLRDVSPNELSGGELRRAAVARALYSDAPLLFADEPTSDLDDENTGIVLSALREAADRQRAVLMVTHEAHAERYADTAWRMNRGRLEKLPA